MANTIKLKRGSGSDPEASDLVVGEVAVRTDTGKLFTKKDDGSVAEISGSGGGGGGGTPGGANTQVQYNSSGSFAGSSNLTFDGTNLAVGGTVTATSTALATGGVRKIFTSASSPQASDGAVGDIWLKY